MSASNDALLQLAGHLKNRNTLPKHMEVSRLGNVFLAGSYNKLPTVAISESVSSGMDTDPDLAALKSLVEFVERRAFHMGKSAGNVLCQTERSDGIAAMPTSMERSAELARRNAYHEAVERYVWARWWDNYEVRHDLFETPLKGAGPVEKILSDLQKYLPIRRAVRVQPKLDDPTLTVIIYFAFLNPIGVISGGACEQVDQSSKAQFRALCELIRHGCAVRKLLEKKMVPSTFYERRLFYFGTTRDGENRATNRLRAKGNRIVNLPVLKLDGPVHHDLSEVIKVHRCYFENQPPFVGGTLERLCL